MKFIIALIGCLFTAGLYGKTFANEYNPFKNTVPAGWKEIPRGLARITAQAQKAVQGATPGAAGPRNPSPDPRDARDREFEAELARDESIGQTALIGMLVFAALAVVAGAITRRKRAAAARKNSGDAAG